MALIEVKDLEKQKKQLRASYEMWEKTIKETIDVMTSARTEDNKRRYTDEQIEEKTRLLRDGEQDIIDKWTFLGGTMEELMAKPQQTKKQGVKKIKEDMTVLEQIKETTEASKKVKPTVTKINNETKPIVPNKKAAETPSNVIPKMEETNPLASYDIIPLPSKGECYPNKQGRIAVSYLTAMDENVIVSPNLYRDNMVLDIILKEKIRNSEIDADELLDGDRDAIILFLRSAAYGNMYTVTTTDPETKKKFDAKIDLSKLKYKDFKLVGDENGYFDYELPISKDKIKFKFLNHRDYVNLARLDEIEMEGLKKTEIEKFSNRIKQYLENDNEMGGGERGKIENALNVFNEWAENMTADPTVVSHRISNELEMEIMAINGNTDRKAIHDYVKMMPIKDSTSLRRYIAQNTPGVDYKFEIEKPESLGGGSMQVFLQFDQFIFLTDTE